MCLDRSVGDLENGLVARIGLFGRLDIHQAVLDIPPLEQRSATLGHEDVHLACLGDGARKEDGRDDKQAEAHEDIWAHAAWDPEEVRGGSVERLGRGVVRVLDEVRLFLQGRASVQ